jgi:transposase
MNELKVNQQQTIVALYRQGWSKRKIARELGVDRSAVRRYLVACDSKPPTHPQTGSATPGISNPPTPRTGSDAMAEPKPPTDPRTGDGPLGGTGPESLCEPWKQVIEAALEAGLSVQRIHQDLVAEHEFGGSYDSVWRFVRKLERVLELPFRRMEVEPGAELQVDFGQGAWVMEQGKRRRPHLFRAILSHSRKGYSEAVWRQTTEAFLRCLENAFRYFGGVTRTVIIDNLKAAVHHADWFDPELNPKLEEFCRHYGTVILPCKPKMPRHKGKVESGVNYGQENALKGHQFESLSAENLHLLSWESQIADKRIHGTTKQQVGKIFAEVEKPRLLPLPAGLFPVFEEAQRTVHRDGHIELARAYYSVPPEYVGRKVWVRWEARLVRVFNLRLEQIALHTRHEPGKFATDPAHIHDRKRTLIERGADYLLDRCRLIGKHSGTWAEQMFKQRGPLAIRVLHGLLALAEKHPVAQLEAACRQAIQYGAWRLRDLRALLDRAPAPQLTFLEKHPLIRDLEDYGKIVPVCFASPTDNQNPLKEPSHESNQP